MPLSWPATLPAPLQGNLNGTRQDNKIRSQPEMGRARVRARFSGQVQYFDATIKITKDLLADFWGFYEQLNYGVDEFTWTHPVHGAMTVRFGEGEPVENHSRGKLWTVSFKLERLP